MAVLTEKFIRVFTVDGSLPTYSYSLPPDRGNSRDPTIQWAPYSPTVLSLLTSENVLLFDVSSSPATAEVLPIKARAFCWGDPHELWLKYALTYLTDVSHLVIRQPTFLSGYQFRSGEFEELLASLPAAMAQRLDRNRLPEAVSHTVVLPFPTAGFAWVGKMIVAVSGSGIWIFECEGFCRVQRIAFCPVEGGPLTAVCVSNPIVSLPQDSSGSRSFEIVCHGGDRAFVCDWTGRGWIVIPRARIVREDVGSDRESLVIGFWGLRAVVLIGARGLISKSQGGGGAAEEFKIGDFAIGATEWSGEPAEAKLKIEKAVMEFEQRRKELERREEEIRRKMEQLKQYVAEEGVQMVEECVMEVGERRERLRERIAAVLAKVRARIGIGGGREGEEEEEQGKGEWVTAEWVNEQRNRVAEILKK